MRENSDGPVETLIGVVVLAAVLCQTWMLIQDATDGDAGRRIGRWWHLRVRPELVRLIAWVDACHLTERMYVEEVEPLLKKESAA